MKTKINHNIIFLILAASILYGCGKNNNEADTKEEKKEKEKKEVVLTKDAVTETGIKTETASKINLTGFLKIPAKIITNQDFEAKVGSLVQGRVYRVYANIGDYVRKGQALMYLEGMEIGEIKSKFLKTKAQLDFAESNYKRMKTLKEQNIGSQKSFFEAEAEYNKALAEFKAEDKRIHSIGLSDEDISDGDKDDSHTSGLLAVKSPVSGVVTERNVVIGQYVDVSTNAFVIIDVNNLIVEGQLREDEIAGIKEKPEISFITQSYPGEEFAGRIFYTSSLVDTQTRTIGVRAKINNRKLMLKPEMFGLMRIPLSRSVNCVAVNSGAIEKIDGVSYVFVAVNDTTYEKRKVETGVEIDDKIEIKEGLKAGERFVSEGAFYLKSELMKESFAEGD